MSDSDSGEPEPAPIEKPKPQAQGRRTMQRGRQNQAQNPQFNQTREQQIIPAQDQSVATTTGLRPGVVRQSRIKDRPASQEAKDSSLKIKIELDLEVEVDLYARVQGDITIGLM